MNAGIPNTANILNMLEPIMLPIAISAFFLIKLVIEAAVSGRLVPIATIVNPITRSEIPNSLAMCTAPLTRHSAHHEKPMLKYWKLDPYLDSPQMSYGYLTTLLICLIPPIWFKIMTPKLDDWDKKFALVNK